MNEDLWLLDLSRLHLPTGWSFILHGRLNALHSDYLFRFFAILVILNADILVVGAGLGEASGGMTQYLGVLDQLIPATILLLTLSGNHD